MKYEPKTLQVQRDGIKQFFAATKSGGAAWWTDSVSADAVDDLEHCETCLSEALAEVERLKALLKIGQVLMEKEPNQ